MKPSKLLQKLINSGRGGGQSSLVQDFTVGLLPEGRLRQKPFRRVTKGPLRTGL